MYGYSLYTVHIFLFFNSCDYRYEIYRLDCKSTGRRFCRRILSRCWDSILDVLSVLLNGKNSCGITSSIALMLGTEGAKEESIRAREAICMSLEGLQKAARLCCLLERVIGPTPKDCSDLSPGTCSGVYTIRPQNGVDISVFCDMATDDGGWTVIQKRFDGTVSFDRFWSNYKTGFGDITGEHWLGNDNLHYITDQGLYKVRFDFEDYSGNTAYAIYDRFNVGDEGTNYLLSISGYHGTAGDSMIDAASQSLNGMKFSTRDKDNDIDYRNDNCAVRKKSGWWHASCTYSNINGIYTEDNSKDSNHWVAFDVRNGLRKTKIMTKPNLEI